MEHSPPLVLPLFPHQPPLSSAAPTHGRRPWFHGLVAVLATLSALLVAQPAASAGELEPRQPALILPGGHAVRPGQLIDLRWSAADSISELEILLSTDGGRRYTRCISSQLDPARRQFLWRVPDLGAHALQLRIRFNRGGREIEGAPAAPLIVTGATNVPEPLGLPVLPESEPTRAPGRSGAPASGTAPGAFEASADSDDEVLAHGPRDIAFAWTAQHGRVGPAPRARQANAAAPQFVPMRT